MTQIKALEKLHRIEKSQLVSIRGSFFKPLLSDPFLIRGILSILSKKIFRVFILSLVLSSVEGCFRDHNFCLPYSLARRSLRRRGLSSVFGCLSSGLFVTSIL